MDSEPTFGTGQITHCPYDHEDPREDAKLMFIKEEREQGKIIETIGCPECGREFVVTYEAKIWRELPATDVRRDTVTKMIE